MGALQTEMLVQVGFAVLCGGAIGLEREVRGRAAGLRTMILVCLGATLAMIVSHSLVQPPGEAERAIVRVDPSRIAAGIVTGIGFLGGAVVVKLGDLVRGVTTAASIWLAAALGIVIGQRFYLLAILGVAVALLVLSAFDQIERLLPSPVYRALTIAASTPKAADAERRVRALLEGRNARIMDVHASSNADAESVELTFHVRIDQGVEVGDLVDALSVLEDARRVSWGPVTER